MRSRVSSRGSDVSPKPCIILVTKICGEFIELTIFLKEPLLLCTSSAPDWVLIVILSIVLVQVVYHYHAAVFVVIILLEFFSLWTSAASLTE